MVLKVGCKVIIADFLTKFLKSSYDLLILFDIIPRMCVNRHFPPRQLFITLLADLGFVWVIVHYGMGGLANGLFLLRAAGLWAWVLFGMVLFLLLYRSDYRSDVPLFTAGLALGYWGEWWGTTRGVWTYWNGATPPDYLPPLWGLGLLTVYRLSGILAPVLRRDLPLWLQRALLGSFLVLPLLAFGWSWPALAAVDWRGRLDGHFLAGLLVAAVLLRYRFELRQAFLLYLCGMLLGGLYEYLGTSMGEWVYITREVPPLWIIPLWGMAAVAMTHLSLGLRDGLIGVWRRITRQQRLPAEV